MTRTVFAVQRTWSPCFSWRCYHHDRMMPSGTTRRHTDEKTPTCQKQRDQRQGTGRRQSQQVIADHITHSAALPPVPPNRCLAPGTSSTGRHPSDAMPGGSRSGVATSKKHHTKPQSLIAGHHCLVRSSTMPYRASCPRQTAGPAARQSARGFSSALKCLLPTTWLTWMVASRHALPLHKDDR